MRKVSAFAGVALLLAGPAFAADLAVKAPPLPDHTSYFTWAGFYAGANAGFVVADTSTTDTLATNGLPWVQNGASWGNKSSGFTGGGQAGYNWQFANLVAGVEGDVGYLGMNGTAPYPLLKTTIATTSGGVLATARVRVGVNVDHVLIYGTGGWAGADAGSNVSQATGVLLNTSSTGFQSGWAAGGGIEWAFSQRWSLKAEYLHYDLGETKVGGVCCGGGVTQFFNIANNGEIVRAGVNYHF